MRVVALLLAGAGLLAGSALASSTPPTPAEYSLAVTQICTGALLFDGRHQIGTRAGAIAVSRDIAATGGGRLRRVDAVPKPAASGALAGQWIAIERRLVAMYASTYLRIWDEIETGYGSPREHARLADVLHALVHKPDALQHQAAALEQRLSVPDCTGGRPKSPDVNASAP